MALHLFSPDLMVVSVITDGVGKSTLITSLIKESYVANVSKGRDIPPPIVLLVPRLAV
jgi:GTPase SAR1 family protein